MELENINKDLEIIDEVNGNFLTYVFGLIENGISIKLIPDANSNYFDEKGGVVQSLPHQISIDLDLNGIINLVACLIEANSKWYLNTRDYSFKHVDIDYSNIQGTNNVSFKVFKRVAGKGNRSTILIGVRENNKPTFTFQLTKTKAFMILGWIRYLFLVKFKDSVKKTSKEHTEFIFTLYKMSDVLLLNRISLRNAETSFIKRFIERIMFDSDFGKSLPSDSIVTEANKIKIYVEEKNTKKYIHIYFISSISENNLLITLSPYNCALLYLFNPERGEVSKDYLETEKIVNERLGIKTYFNAKGTYIEYLNGTYFSLRLPENEKYKIKDKKGLPLLNILSENDNFNLLEINLKNKWISIFSYFAQLINNQNRYNSKGVSCPKFEFETYTGGETYAIVFTIFKVKNSKKVQINIKKSLIGGEKVSKININTYVNAIPSLVELFIKITSKIENYHYYINRPDNRSLELKNEGNKILFQEKGVKYANKYITESDRLKLLTSAKHRILYGRWLSFRGEFISVDDTSYLTTQSREYNLEIPRFEKGLYLAFVFIAVLGRGENDY